jgi:hypothetical protein
VGHVTSTGTGSRPRRDSRTEPEAQQANSTPESQSIALLKAPYSSGKYKFDAIFSFDRNNNTLTGVRLKLKNATYATELLGSLRAKYGPPAGAKINPILSSAVWYSDENQISYVSIGDKAAIDYAPRITEDNKGL